MPSFTPPTVEDNPAVLPVRDRFRPTPPLADRLFRHYTSRARGRTVVKNPDGTYTTYDTPSQDVLDAASVVYLGGHTYEVTSTEQTALEAAGYTVS